MKKYIFVILSILLISILQGKEPVKETLNQWFPKGVIEKNVANFLKNHNLTPYVQSNQKMVRYEILEPIIDGKDLLSVFIACRFENEKGPASVFLVGREKKTDKVAIELLFTSNDPVISPQLFFDIMRGGEF